MKNSTNLKHEKNPRNFNLRLIMIVFFKNARQDFSRKNKQLFQAIPRLCTTVTSRKKIETYPFISSLYATVTSIH